MTPDRRLLSGEADGGTAGASSFLFTLPLGSVSLLTPPLGCAALSALLRELAASRRRPHLPANGCPSGHIAHVRGWVDLMEVVDELGQVHDSNQYQRDIAARVRC